MIPNLARGKTEAVMSLVGPGSRKVRKEVYTGHEPSLALHSEVWPQARLRVVSAYKHVGGIIQVGGGVAKETKARIGSAWAAFRKRRKQVFMSPIVTHEEKAILFTSLVESTLYYGVGAWPRCDEAVTAKFQGALVAMARLMLRPTFTIEQARHVGADYAMTVARILPAREAVHIERLRHLRVTITKANPELWALLHHEGSWLRDAQESIEWLKALFQAGGKDVTNISTWQAVVSTSLGRPAMWKGILRTAKRLAFLRAQWEAEKSQFLGLLLRQLRAVGAEREDDLEKKDSTQVCAVCQKAFTDLRAWSHHAFKTHGRVREERQLVAGLQCPVCLKHFPNTEKLCNHVRYSRQCKGVLIASESVVQPTPGVGHRAFDDGSARLLPAVRADGPLARWPQPQTVFEEDRPDEGVLLELESLFCTESQSIASFGELWQRVRGAFSSVCLQVSRLQATAVEWRRRLEEELGADEDCEVQWASWHGLISKRLLAVDWCSWLVPGLQGVVAPISSFRDAELVLPWLHFGGVDLTTFSAAPELRLVIGGARVDAVETWSYQDCWEHPESVDVSSWDLTVKQGELTVVSVVGLLDSLALPTPLSNHTRLEPSLRRLRLHSDLTRAVIHLWANACPAILFCGNIGCTGLQAILRLAPFSSSRDGVTAAGNCPCDDCFSRFTFS